MTSEVKSLLEKLDLDSLGPNERIAFAYLKGDKERLV